MKRLVRVDDRQITITAHRHTINGTAISSGGPIESAMTYTYVTIPHYEELTWRERRKRKNHKKNRSKNGGNLTLKL